MKILIWSLLSVMVIQAKSQEINQETENMIERLIPEGEELDTEFVENLIQLYNNPIDLNSAEEKELQQLLILSPQQIQHLLQYRSESGAFISTYELQVIPHFDLNTIEKILPFIAVEGKNENPKDFINHFWANPNKYILTRYDNRLGEKRSSENIGDNHKLLLSFRNSKPQHFSFGILLEKDAGEKLSWQPSTHYYGTDFLSWHFCVNNRGKLKTFLIGDYQIQFGQGLVLGTGFAPGKGGESILTIKRINKGISPHFSTLEYSFLRGAATTIKTGPVELTTFISSQKTDATLEANEAFSKVFNGYHRTLSELSKRKQIQENTFGGNISIKPTAPLHVGISGVLTKYENPVAAKEELYRIHDFTGRTNVALGMDFSLHWKNMNLFGETAISGNRKSGTVIGLIASLTSTIDVSCLIRNYEKEFHSIYANSFNEGGKVQNEKGIYWGLKYRPVKHMEVTAYADFFRFPWLKYQVSAPSEGQEYLGKFSYIFSKMTRLSLQAKLEKKEKDYSESEMTKVLQPVYRKNFSFHIESSTGIITFRSKLVYTNLRHASTISKGFSIIQDLDIKLKKISFSTRLALFDSKDFDSRLYVYERDVLYTFSMPFYYGNGMRNYLLIRYKVWKDLDIWVKLSGTQFFTSEMDKERIDTRDLRVQIRYTL